MELVLKTIPTGSGIGLVALSRKHQSESFNHPRYLRRNSHNLFIWIVAREWKFMHPEGRIPIKKPYGYSIRFAKVGGTSVFSRQVLYTMVITNLVTLLLGTGIG